MEGHKTKYKNRRLLKGKKVNVQISLLQNQTRRCRLMVSIQPNLSSVNKKYQDLRPSHSSLTVVPTKTTPEGRTNTGVYGKGTKHVHLSLEYTKREKLN